MFPIHLRDRAGAILLATLVSLAWAAPLTAQQSQPTPTDDNPLGFTGAEMTLNEVVAVFQIFQACALH